jgi:uncharacterized membrane protein
MTTLKAKLSIYKERLISPYLLFLIFPSFIFWYLAVISLLAPIFEEYFFYTISNHFYNVLSGICHQFPSKSLWIVNRPMGLCSRCFTLYASFSISILFVPLFKKDKDIFIISFLLLPLILDGLFQYYGIRGSNNLTRIFSGILFGVAASVIYKYFCFIISDFFISKSNRGDLAAYKYINIIIGLILVFNTNLYALLICFN